MTWIVAGPPCSGKTTWANTQTPGLVLDWDVIYSEVSGLELYEPGTHDSLILT